MDPERAVAEAKMAIERFCTMSADEPDPTASFQCKNALEALTFLCAQGQSEVRCACACGSSWYHTMAQRHGDSYVVTVPQEMDWP